jgi:hypothetical protein
VQVASWIGLAVLLIISVVAGTENGSGTSTAETPASAPATSPSATVALTALPVTLTNADFRDGDFSQGLRLGGGDYTLTVTSNKPGPGIEVRVYELTQECRGVLGIVGGAGVVLPKGDTTATERQKPLEAGCYSLLLHNLLDAKVTVKFAR